MGHRTLWLSKLRDSLLNGDRGCPFEDSVTALQSSYTFENFHSCLLFSYLVETDKIKVNVFTRQCCLWKKMFSW